MALARKQILPPDALFLGLDSSTQSLKATVLDGKLRVVASRSVHFDSELPHYKTRDGVHRATTNASSAGGTVTAPVLMWVDALELLLDKLQADGFPFERVVAVSGSGQQHGSVYWRRGSGIVALQGLHPGHTLSSQLKDAFSLTDSPVWMDSSTSAQCRAIEAALGGAATLSDITGSRAYERFTGPQIRKIYEHRREVYDETERISLVSSFMASLLVGNYVSIDHSDGAGMNLMDLKQRVWSKIVLDATAPDLEAKLGELAPSHSIAGKLSTFFIARYKFNQECLVVHWSGDNPNSLAGLALNNPGDLAISLGTSDTVFGITADPHPGLEGHVFPNPVDPSCYMVMLCYKNGSLTREEVRNRVSNGSWDDFNKKLSLSPPLNEGKVGFYYTEPEIIPPLPVGIHRFKLTNAAQPNGFLKVDEVQEFDSSAEVRAVVEGQFLSMRAHSERIGMPSPPERVIATGGASANCKLLELIAQIFGCRVYTAERPDSASLGAALRAAHGWLCYNKRRFIPISELYDDGYGDGGDALQCKLAAAPGGEELHKRYGVLATHRMEIERDLIKELVG